jgi:hypothetical protein
MERLSRQLFGGLLMRASSCRRRSGCTGSSSSRPRRVSGGWVAARSRAPTDISSGRSTTSSCCAAHASSRSRRLSPLRRRDGWTCATPGTASDRDRARAQATARSTNDRLQGGARSCHVERRIHPAARVLQRSVAAHRSPAECSPLRRSPRMQVTISAMLAEIDTTAAHRDG